MAREWGLGPVFAFECLTDARRWQGYARRATLLLLLLFGLYLIWAPSGRTFTSHAEAGALGDAFFRVVVTIQLTMVLVAAPAATAGAICVDKNRGTLIHAFATDLGAREIVFGKLAAQLGPVLSLILCGLPVLLLSGLLGGVVVSNAVGAYLATAGVAFVGCALALTFSVWARKPHQALLPTYFILGFWVAAYPVLDQLGVWGPGIPTTTSQWTAALSNPYVSAFAGSIYAGESFLLSQVAFLAGCIAMSVLLALLASERLRPVVLGQESRPARRGRPGLPARILALLPGPSLDDNPVLWREWHRKKPSRWTGRLWSLYAIVSGLASATVIVLYYLSPVGDIHVYAAMVNAIEVAIGLLLLSVSAATALAEERDRGSLDIVMATPLPTRAIVWGKWWGTLATVPRLAILPIWVAGALALLSGRWFGLVLMIGLIFAYSVTIASLGLLLATWIPRLGRAVTATVLVYVLMTVGWTLLLAVADLTVSPTMGAMSRPEDREKLLMANPYFGVFRTTELSGRFGDRPFYYTGWFTGGGTWLERELGWPLFWMATYCTVAAIMLLLTLMTFDVSMGRTPDSMDHFEAYRRRYGAHVRARPPSAHPSALSPEACAAASHRSA